MMLFVIGLLIGSLVGTLVVAMCAAAKQGDDDMAACEYRMRIEQPNAVLDRLHGHTP